MNIYIYIYDYIYIYIYVGFGAGWGVKQHSGFLVMQDSEGMERP